MITIEQIASWENLCLAAVKAAKGKRNKPDVAMFDLYWADRLLDIQDALLSGNYKPGKVASFYIREPKRRKITAASFDDRVIHHALVQQMEPWFETRFSKSSYANRKGKGTHAAIHDCQKHVRRYRYCLQMDIVQYFPSIDHQLLLNAVFKAPMCSQTKALVRSIVAGHTEGCQLDKGLPIGNLTSQFWSNVFLNVIDQRVVRELRLPYLRYVDDLIVFANDRHQLWAARIAIAHWFKELSLHEHKTLAQVQLCAQGIPWLGAVIYPYAIRLKRRVYIRGQKRVGRARLGWKKSEIAFAELMAIEKGWAAHLRIVFDKEK